MNISDIARISIGMFFIYLGVIGIYKSIQGFSFTLVPVVIMILSLIAGSLFILMGFVMAALPVIRKWRKRQTTASRILPHKRGKS